MRTHAIHKQAPLVKRMDSRPWVKFIDDERQQEDGIIVTLERGWYFKNDPGCGVRGFDSIGEMRSGTKREAVYFAE